MQILHGSILDEVGYEDEDRGMVLDGHLQKHSLLNLWVCVEKAGTTLILIIPKDLTAWSAQQEHSRFRC